ncbi:2-oxoglutarate dehydrogenase E1 subunit family protein, partial [Leucobacter sp. M11]|uniref:2-oxoglutarate dehydrogenase E1 subunit family protein n=1 Tax=Leucobacter sp. M11 TaxID=2993565 RepID=UPI002D9D171D|nr:hypothetical protein [Leucobacter sp. M11]
MTGQKTEPSHGNTAEDFGANAWLVDELYKQYREDPKSVDESWWPVLEQYQPEETGT